MFKASKNKNTKTNLNQLPINTVISSDITIIGDVRGESAIRIDGKVEGNVDTKKGIVLGENAVVTGSLKSTNIIIFGKLNGNLNSKELQLKSTGIVNGDLNVESIEIEMGGRHNGHLNMKIEKVEIKEEIPKPTKK